MAPLAFQWRTSVYYMYYDYPNVLISSPILSACTLVVRSSTWTGWLEIQSVEKYEQ